MIKLLKKMGKREVLMAVLCALLVLGQVYFDLTLPDYTKELEVILASDDVTFGGSKKYTKKKVKVTDGKAVLDLSAYSAVYYSIAV